MINRTITFFILFILFFLFSGNVYAQCVCGKANDSDTPINYALLEIVKNKDFSYAFELLKSQPDANIVNACGAGLLSFAAFYNHVELASKLISLNANPNIKNYAGETPIHSAAQWSSNEVLKILLEAGGDPNVILYECSTYEAFNTPLLTAALNDNIEGIKILLEHGADFSYLTDDNLSIFHILIIRGYGIEVVSDLVNHIKQLNQIEKAKEVLLLSVIELSKNKELEFLLRNDFNPNTIYPFDVEYNTPILISAFIGNVEAVKLLIKHGAELNYKNHMGYSLKRIVLEEDIEELKYLLDEY